ncbi:MAG: DUF2934 domain-containing protein [Bryobacteraceae bacterium]
MSHSRSEKNASKRSREAQEAGSALRSGSTASSGAPVDAIPAAENRGGNAPAVEAQSGPTYPEIAARAYHCWHERGCPEGSPEVDWSRAEEELRSRHQSKAAASAAT